MNLLLKCVSVEATKAFCLEVLGFEVTDSDEGACTVKKEGGTIIFSEENLWSGPPHCTGTSIVSRQRGTLLRGDKKQSARMLAPGDHALRHAGVCRQRLQ